MDESSLAIKGMRAADDEQDGIKHQVEGQRRCIVVVPRAAAPGRPWSWRGCYWDHQPQTEVELLRRGFHIAYVESSATLKPGRQWEAWYAFLTEKHGLSRKPAFVGMSRGGEYAYTWATSNPDKVSCVYADNPGGNPDILMKLGLLARYDVPLLEVCGSIDPLLGRYALPIENIYQQFGGRISLMIKDGTGHHPHSLQDPKPIADFIEQSVQSATNAPPSFAGSEFTRTSYYSPENSYRPLPREATWMTCRGPLFAPCYDRYSFQLKGVEGTITVIQPKVAAPGKPWVFRAEFVDREAALDQALLAKGFHIVTGPVPYNADGPLRSHWEAVFSHLVAHGFSRKPVLEGRGGAAGDAYAWAIEHPDRVSCIYAENPILRSQMMKAPLLDNLAPLAKARVPLLHVCGSLDPWLESQTRVLEKRYQELGGQVTVILKEGEGHLPTAPKDPQPVVDFILKHTFDFDGAISREVLENYLSRSISMEGLLNGRGDLDDNLRMLKSTGAKFIGRSLCLWGGEASLLQNLERAKQQIPKVREADPEMILQACVFEIVSTQVEQVPVPDWAFLALGLPVEKRNFRYADMIYPEGQGRNWGPNAAVPDVSRPETKLWFYYLAASYVDLGFEAIHFGQVELMAHRDPKLSHWSQVLGLVRAYAAKHARRHLVLCDGHVPSGGLVQDGHLLLDFHSFPLRVKEVPERPQEAILQAGFSDGIYGRSKGGITPSGWSCEHLPYLVELDNWGASKTPGQAGAGGIWIWGYDEITWFAHQSQQYRSNWLNYAWDWVRRTDTNGHLQMPGSRTMRSPLDGMRWYYANTASPAVPTGLGDEEAIRTIWAAQTANGNL